MYPAIYNLAYPPDFKVYPRGKHPINLKAGERTKYRVKYPNGTYPSIDSLNNKFKFIYPNGKIVEAWKIKTMPESGYWLEAIADEKLVLSVE